MIQYCSVECQKEHWKLVHRSHCHQLASDKKAEGEDVNLYSHHPFPINGVEEDVTESLVVAVQQIVSKMRSTRHPLLKVFPAAFKDLEEKMEWNRELIWSGRKTTPKEGIQDVTGNLEASLGPELTEASFTLRSLGGRVKDPLGLFRTLCLVSELQVFHKILVVMSSFKEPLKPLQSEDGPSVAQSAGCEGLRLIFDTEFSFAGGLEQQIYTQEDAGLILQLQYLL